MFENLKASLTVKKDATAEFVIVQTIPEMTLVCRPATSAHPAYYNDTLRDVGLKLRRQQGKDVTVEYLEQTRAEERVLFAKHIIVGWRNVFDADKEVPWSAVAAKELMEKLPDDIFDEIRAFCRDDNNFRARKTDVEGAAKN